MVEIIIAAMMLFTNKVYIKPDGFQMPVIYAENVKKK